MGWAGGTNRSVVDKREGDVQLLSIKHNNDFLKKYEYVNKKKQTRTLFFCKAKMTFHSNDETFFYHLIFM